MLPSETGALTLRLRLLPGTRKTEIEKIKLIKTSTSPIEKSNKLNKVQYLLIYIHFPGQWEAFQITQFFHHRM